MGNKYEVLVWMDRFGNGEYKLHEFWRGENFFKALWNLWLAHMNTDTMRVTLVWCPKQRK